MNEQRKLTMRRWTRALSLAVLLAISLVGCQSSPTPTPTVTPTLAPTATTEPPTSTPLLLPPAPMVEPANDVEVQAGRRIAVSASATDADGYRWRLDGDGEISLGDAIVSLQFISKITSSSTFNEGADVNRDNQLGIEEVIYILQKIAGLR